MMMLERHLVARERHERIQREAEQSNADARRLAAGRTQNTNRPGLKFLGRR
jgi:hypothetical protein